MDRKEIVTDEYVLEDELSLKFFKCFRVYFSLKKAIKFSFSSDFYFQKIRASKM